MGDKTDAPTYFDDIEKWENSFDCNGCGTMEFEDFVFEMSVANGEVWKCKFCKSETIVDHQPNEDNY